MSTVPLRGTAAKMSRVQRDPVDPKTLKQKLLFSTGLPRIPEDFRVEAQKLVENLTLQHSGGGGKAFAFTSSHPGEGVSTVCSSVMLAFGLSASGTSLYIDANFASPLAFSRSERSGFSDLLLGRCEVADSVDILEGMPIALLGSGQATAEVATQASDEQIASTFLELRSQFNVIVVDLAPPLLCPFSNRIARVLDGLALVVEAHKTDRLEIEMTVNSLRRAQVPLLGLVYNRRRFRA